MAGKPQVQVRKLHMTGPATFPSPLLTTERAAVKISKDAELSKRPAAEDAASGSSVRHFNTSRTLKAVNDTSTIDFAYLPDFNPTTEMPTAGLRVPLLPENSYTAMGRALSIDEPVEVLRAEIHTVSADSTHVLAPSAMADVHDNNTIDFHGVKETIVKTAEQIEEQAGMVKKVWSGLLDDVFGAKASKA
ncbi:hypothetical protein K402DRAFT_329344 [Aulographum hederae CBS 113979]|uniref:Uncharacterized protein n=1 Tax=Aulographum hederae CBS 113979 TaxID=1176131 RepID=A0A6G1H497_9PEZI|nr:hypothetical protein K402DRAFT_329344 [Aulographum hederae CBS 113979]